MGVDQVIAIFGPTGVGKTAVAVELAEWLHSRGEESVAVSCDALQIYKGLETLTGVASLEEQRQLEHRLVAFQAVDHTFSVGEYASLAHQEIDKIIEDGKCPIVIGGTGLYLRAALTDLNLAPVVPAEIRINLHERLETEGLSKLYQELVGAAPWVATEIKETDTQRVLRALELLEIDELKPRDSSSELWTETVRRPTVLIGLTMEREALYRAIESRIDMMVSQGVIEEVKRADQAGASVTARKALGFRELLEEDIEKMKTRTRQYAKRQLTWMRKLPNVHTIDVTAMSPRDVAEQIAQLL